MPTSSPSSPIRPSRRAGAAWLLLTPLALVCLAACDSGAVADDPEPDRPSPTSTATESPGESAPTTPPDAGEVPVDWSTDAQEWRHAETGPVDLVCPPDGTPQPIWGVETYTDDSSVCTAAVHVGLVTLEDGGPVTIAIEPGLDVYQAGTANGVESASFAGWPGSFTFPEAPPGSGTFGPGGEAWSQRATDLELLDVGATEVVLCTPGGEAGPVWGTGTYTGDSSVCTAAVHAGLASFEDGGVVEVELVEPPSEYEGSEAHGVTSESYGPYDPAFELAPVDAVS